MTLSAKNYHEVPEVVQLCKDIKVEFTMYEEQKKTGIENISFENRYIISEQEETKKLLLEPYARCDFF